MEEGVGLLVCSQTHALLTSVRLDGSHVSEAGWATGCWPVGAILSMSVLGGTLGHSGDSSVAPAPVGKSLLLFKRK